MTEKEKRILGFLAVVIVLLCLALAALCIFIVLKDPQARPDPAEMPVQYVQIDIPAAATSNPTMCPIVTITIPAPDDMPEVTAIPAGSTAQPTATRVPDTNTTPTPEAAYVRLPTSDPANTPVPTVPKGMAFSLGILGKTVNVAKNVEADTLEQTPGWLPTSAKPGKEGTCVVYGHRNRNHLLVLKDVEKGDEIDVFLSDGKVFTYIVDKIEILDTNESLRIPTIEGKHLILMTCYPFYYTGHAPQKYVVTCTLREGNHV